jgi:hypothetical protein
MTADSIISALNRLLVVHNRSLARYLSYASPTWYLGDELARDTLQAISNDQQATADRAGQRIMDVGGVVEYGSFPIAYTGYHDLSFDFLLNKLIEDQRRNIAAIEKCVPQLSADPLSKALAEESLGAAKGHLESLLEIEQRASVSLVQ